MGAREPDYRCPLLQLNALRFVALRKEDINEDTNRERERKAYTRTCARALSPVFSLLLGQSFQPTPSLLCELA